MALNPRAVAAVDQFAALVAHRAAESGVDLRAKELGFGIGLMLQQAIFCAGEDSDVLVMSLLHVGLAVAIAAEDHEGSDWILSVIDTWERA